MLVLLFIYLSFFPKNYTNINTYNLFILQNCPYSIRGENVVVFCPSSDVVPSPIFKSPSSAPTFIWNRIVTYVIKLEIT